MKLFLYRAARLLKTLNYWLVARFAMALLWLMRRLPADSALVFADKMARRLGPFSRRHQVALDNLRHAYPGLSEAERGAIASDMWGNMARLACEYVFLDQIFDFDPGSPSPGRIEVDGVERFLKIRSEERPHIIFTAHVGNFELLPIAAAAFDLDVAAMFRPPNNPYIADYVFSTRRTKMGRMVASRAGVSFALSGILDKGGNVGLLVDQKFIGGAPTTFFGRPCETSPLLPKLARHFGCDVYPARSKRLAGNRFLIELQDRLELPRDAAGEVDVARTAQLLNDVVEGWVREDPGQWMWFHKRWETGRKRRRPASKA